MNQPGSPGKSFVLQAVWWLPESDIIDASQLTDKRAHCRGSWVVALTMEQSLIAVDAAVASIGRVGALRFSRSRAMATDARKCNNAKPGQPAGNREEGRRTGVTV